MLKTLRSRLLFFSMSATIFVMAMLGLISYFTFHGFLRHNVMQTTYNNLKITMDNIDWDLHLIDQMLEWFSINNEINAYVMATDQYPDDMRFKAMTAYNIVRNTVFSNGLTRYINKIIIGDLNGNSIQSGNVSGHASDYSQAIDNLSVNEGGLIEEPFFYSQDQPVIPISKQVFSVDGLRMIGNIFVTVNTSIITRYFESFNLEKGSSLYIGIGPRVYDISDPKEFKQVELPTLEIRGIIKDPPANTLFGGPWIPHIEVGHGSREETLIVAMGKASQWFLAQTSPTTQLAWQNAIFIRLLFILAGFMVFLVIAVTAIVNWTVNRPISLINKRLRIIATGDFTPDPNIEFHNEIGNIGLGINHMVKEIETLIENRLEDEKTRKDLEFRILQNQINPHFLYNTLNSIKWMATIQKTTGIAEMANALAVLLGHLSRGTAELITLKEELVLVREYCTIQEFRSGGIARTEINLESPDLERCRVIKFTLQPLVENAFFHGIEPKMSPGKITINASGRPGDTLSIEVHDDGVGIAPEKLSSIFSKQGETKNSLNHIGLKNVDERVKLTFGQQYGISVESRKDVYTKVTVRMPYVVEEGEGWGEPDV